MNVRSLFGVRRRQHGLSVITAIFLLLLMSLLGAAMATLLSTAHINTAADIGGSRAFQAARAGVEWGLFQLNPDPKVGDALPDCFTPTAVAIPDHTVTVSCLQCPSVACPGLTPAQGTYREGNREIRIYRITSRANAVGAKAPGIEREIVVTVEKCLDPGVTVAPFEC